jgi:hypothetical protein
LEVWEIIFVLVILKIPVAYVGWVLWWAIKAEPELGTEGGTEGVNWKPWRGPSRGAPPSRSRRGWPERSREQARSRVDRSQARAGGGEA